jgi:CheY-like chemotaxis protein
MFQGKVILIVDDEADLREILRDELTFEGAKVLEASNGRMAQELIKENRLDAVLSDIRMPGGDGATLARQIRELHPSRPVLMLITGFADLQSEEAYDLGADGYVTKPFHLEALKHHLHRLLIPFELRWTETPFDQNTSKTLNFSQTVIETIQRGQIKMGRGGFFLQTAPGDLRPGQLVRIQFSDFQPIEAQVRWTRSELVDSKKPGLGLEFLHLDPKLLAVLNQQFPFWFESRSFIPRN